MNNPVHYSLTIPLTHRNRETVYGAWLAVLEGAQWTVDKVSSLPQIRASLHREHLEEIRLEIKKDPAGAVLWAHFYTSSIHTTAADLETLALSLQQVYVQLMAEGSDIDLQYKYRQMLKASELKGLKLNGEGGGIKWALRVLFTAHPAQATAWLMIANVLVYILMVIDGLGIFETSLPVVIKWGAADKEHVMDGEYWRLLAANFIHFDFGHLLGNMLGMVYASAFLMLAVSRWQMIAGYIATGLIAMSVSIWWHPETTSAGASGAIFGMYGMLLGLALTPIFGKGDRITVIVYLFIYGGINLLYGLKDGIDNSAHIGGLLAGIPIGLLYSLPWHFNVKPFYRVALVGAVLLFGLGLAALLIKNTHYYGTDFWRLEKEYSNHENAALDIYNLSDSLPQAKLSASRQALAIFRMAQPYADSMAYIVKGTPDFYRQYAQRLSSYNAYRTQEFKLLEEYYKGIRAGDDDSLTLLSTQVDSMLQLFKSH